MEHQHIGVEVLLDEFDNIDEVYLKAKSKVEEWATGLMENPVIWHDEPLPVIQVKESPIEHQIKDCNTIEELGKLRQGLPVDLMKPYMNKLKELTEQIK